MKSAEATKQKGSGICLDCGVQMEARMDQQQKVWWCRLCHNETNRS